MFIRELGLFFSGERGSVWGMEPCFLWRRKVKKKKKRRDCDEKVGNKRKKRESKKSQ